MAGGEDTSCPCAHVERINEDFKEYKIIVNDRFDKRDLASKLVSDGQQKLEIKFASIDVKLNIIIGVFGIMAVAVAAVVIPMIFG